MRSAAETVRLGESVGRSLEAGDLVLLYGELGAGKTTLVRGLARGIGFRGRASSPTFALAHVYRGKRLTLHHLDLYRLRDGDVGELGLDELLADPRGAVVVEWPQAARWPKARLEVRLSHVRQGRRALIRDLRKPDNPMLARVLNKITAGNRHPEKLAGAPKGRELL